MSLRRFAHRLRRQWTTYIAAPAPPDSRNEVWASHVLDLQLAFLVNRCRPVLLDPHGVELMLRTDGGIVHYSFSDDGERVSMPMFVVLRLKQDLAEPFLLSMRVEFAEDNIHFPDVCRLLDDAVQDLLLRAKALSIAQERAFT